MFPKVLYKILFYQNNLTENTDQARWINFNIKSWNINYYNTN